MWVIRFSVAIRTSVAILTGGRNSQWDESTNKFRKKKKSFEHRGCLYLKEEIGCPRNLATFMSSAKEGQEVQKTSCFKHSSQCPLKMRPVLSTGHEIPPGSSSPSSLPPRNPPPRPPWSSAFERLPGSCPRLCPYNGTMLLWGRETMALWDLWILKQQPSKSDYHPTSASGLLSDGRISHVGTHERKQKMFVFFLPGWFITSCLNLTRCLQCWKCWKDEGFIYLKSYETFHDGAHQVKADPRQELQDTGFTYMVDLLEQIPSCLLCGPLDWT